MRRQVGALAFFAVLVPAGGAWASPPTLGLKPLLGAGESQQQALFVATICASEGVRDAHLEVQQRWLHTVHVVPGRIDVPAGGCVRHPLVTEQGGERLLVLRDAQGRGLAYDRSTEWWRGGIALDPSLKGILNVNGNADVSTLPPEIDLPADALLWSNVSWVATRDRTLSDQRPNVRRAVEEWVERGGALVIAAEEDAPLERRGLGVIATMRADESLGYRLRPGSGEPPRRRLQLDPTQDATRTYFDWDYRPYGDRVQEIDPTSRTRPNPAWSWALLLGYVVLLGPLSYRFFARRGRSVLALGTVPASAACIMGALLGQSLLDKGVGPRFAAIALAQAVAGDRTAAARRTAGIVTTSSGRLRIESSVGALLSPLGTRQRRSRWIVTETGPLAEPHRTVLETWPVGLWETVFVNEGAHVDLGGAVDIAAVGDGFRVTNRTRFDLAHVTVEAPQPQHAGLVHYWFSRSIPAGSSIDLRRADATNWDPTRFPDSPTAAVIGESGLYAGYHGNHGGASLTATLDRPLFPPFRGFERISEPTWLQVVMP